MQMNRRIPRGEKRRDEIAAIAEWVFLEHGFDNTTMQSVASRAGASKETLYRHFGSKEGLFSKVVRARVERIYRGEGGEFGLRDDPRQVLNQLGLNLLRGLLRDDPLRLFRIGISEMRRTPDLGRIFFEQGPNQILQYLAAYLEEATRLGLLKCEEPIVAARVFLGAIIGYLYILQLTAPHFEPVTEDIIHQHVECVVTMFLAAYGPTLGRGQQPEAASEHGNS